MSGSPTGFAWRECRDGTVVVTHHGRVAATLRGRAARRFLDAVASGGMPDGPQQVMARVTGNHRRGNERTARDHPRNRGGA